MPPTSRQRRVHAHPRAHYQHLMSRRVREGGAEQLAEQLDREYARGKVAAVLVLEPTLIGVSDSDALVRAPPRLMRRQTLAVTALTLDLERMSARAIAGRVDDHRRRRSAGAETCEQ